MFSKYPDVMTVKQVAEALGICRNKAYQMINNHVLGCKRIGRRIVVPKSCLIDYLESSRYNVCVMAGNSSC